MLEGDYIRLELSYILKTPFSYSNSSSKYYR
jgi:hypothetical protein